MANNLAVTGNVTIGGTLVVTGTTNLGAAADTVLVTNFNADKVDGADLSTDGTLAANSDVLVPSQKAVKTYADTNKVALTGDQTVAGVKTFTSVPLLPANTVEESDIQAGAVTEAKLGALAVTAAKLASAAVTDAKCSKSFTGDSQVITGSSSWVPPAGLYMFAVPAQIITEIYVSAAWRATHDGYTESVETGGFYWCDGTNVRLRNNWTASQTVYYLKLN